MCYSQYYDGHPILNNARLAELKEYLVVKSRFSGHLTPAKSKLKPQTKIKDITVLTNEQIQTNWSAVKDKIQHCWPEMTDSDIRECDRDTQKLVARIHQITGADLPEIAQVLESINMGEGIMDSVSKQTSKALDSTQQAASEVMDQTQQAAAAALQQGQEVAGEMSEAVREGYAETERIVRRNPVEAVAICFGVGLVSGVLIGLSMRGR